MFELVLGWLMIGIGAVVNSCQLLPEMREPPVLGIVMFPAVALVADSPEMLTMMLEEEYAPVLQQRATSEEEE